MHHSRRMYMLQSFENLYRAFAHSFQVTRAACITTIVHFIVQRPTQSFEHETCNIPNAESSMKCHDMMTPIVLPFVMVFVSSSCCNGVQHIDLLPNLIHILRITHGDKFERDPFNFIILETRSRPYLPGCANPQTFFQQVLHTVTC